jgi:biotin synthase-related radical SAM superfamily protein
MANAGEDVKNNGNQLSNKALKDALYRELETEIDLQVHGISVEPEELAKLNFGSVYQVQDRITSISDKPFAPGAGVPALPRGFYLPYGIFSGFNWNPNSPYALVSENGKPVIYKYIRKKEIRIGEIEFRKKDDFFNQKTSDGVPFSKISNSVSPEGTIGGGYSKECSLKDKGEDCLFCDINYAADAYLKDKNFRKTAAQIAEVYAAAVEAGKANRINVTGGFMAERRELDTYVDIAEAIKARVGQEKFVGSISMGAPLDYSVIDKYKEAGYYTVRMDIEVWDKNIRKAIVPGKENQCGGWDNWVKALEYAVTVFGWGRVGSNIVAGIEPKKSSLEGVEYLASKGIGCPCSVFRPKPGTGLEGFRTPETSWHLDRVLKEAAILKRYGFTVEQLQHLKPAAQAVHYIYLIEEEYFENGKLKQWKFPSLIKPRETATAGR